MTSQRPTDDDFCVRQLKALADRTRLAILVRLLEGPKHVGELNNQLNVEQSLLSHHLKILREAGFVQATRDGKSVRYQLVQRYEFQSDMKSLDLGCCVLSFDETV